MTVTKPVSGRRRHSAVTTGPIGNKDKRNCLWVTLSHSERWKRTPTYDETGVEDVANRTGSDRRTRGNFRKLDFPILYMSFSVVLKWGLPIAVSTFNGRDWMEIKVCKQSLGARPRIATHTFDPARLVFLGYQLLL